MRPLFALLVLLALPAHARPVRLTSATAGEIAAAADGTGPHGVLLVAGAPGPAWTQVQARLAAKGFLVLGLELPAPAPTTAASAGPWIEAVRAGVAWLGDQGATSVTLVGAEAGGAVALHAGLSLPAVEQLVWLSPRLAAAGLPLGDDLAAWSRPLLLVAGADDPSGVRAVGALAPRAKGPVRSESVAGARIGVDLLAHVPQAEGLVAGWLHEAAARAASGAATPRATLAEDRIETSGTRYGEGAKPK